ncbi:MAG: AAA family ATPase [Oligoflexia bacterium]|nr:AAA family ATPase [Oligoflexia bacterium]
MSPQPAVGQIDAILARRAILVTCGTGGVGKTTLSAAIAMRAALAGRKAVVVTIDPAKRLATSLGLDELGDHATDLTPLLRKALAKARQQQGPSSGLPPTLTGSLHAIIPDTRRTFETFIRELAPTESLAERVMGNPIFQIFAKEFSGANEYMALERLYALHRSGEYDCIILDTPPSRDTLAFLDAPKLLVQFFEDRLIRWLVLPANKLVSTGMRKALGILERLTGAGFMTNLFDFASALFEVRARFADNLKAIMRLLESPEVGFIMVTTPSSIGAAGSESEVRHFLETLGKHGLHFDGVAVNRTLGYLEADQNAGRYPEARAVIAGLQEKERLALTGVPVCARLPELARDVHSVEDLFHVCLAFAETLPHPASGIAAHG